MAATTISSLFNLNLLSTGRRLFALGQVMARAQELALAEVADHAQAAIAHDDQTRTLDLRWAARDAPSALDALVKPIDNKVDRLLTTIRDVAQAQLDLATPANGLEGKVEGFLKTVYPLGVAHVTALPSVEELAQVDRIVKLTHGPQAELAAAVAELGLTAYVQRLADLAEEYRSALAVRSVKDLTFDTVKAARERGQELLLETVALIIAHTRGGTPAAVAARASLLAPVVAQNDAVREYIRQRRRVEDVNPQTGEVEPEPAPPTDPDPGPVAEVAPPPSQA